MTNSTAIEIAGLSKRFGPVQAVSDMSFKVDAGRVTGFLGPNGAGKSTTLRMLLGLIRADRGSGTFGGRRYGELEHPSGHVGAVLENASFHPGRSGRNHLRVLAAAGEHPTERVTELLEQVGSPPRRTAASRATRWACASGSPSPPRCSETPRC
jgi:ABC-2 type transport system ATP-binding protein